MLFKTGNRRLNLGTKFILQTCSLVLITVLVIGIYVIRDQEQHNYELLLDHGRSLIRMVAQNSELGIYTEDTGSLRHILDIIGSDPALAYIFILNAEERVLIYKTASDFPIHIPQMDRPPDFPGTIPILHKSFFNKEDGKYYVNIMAPVMSQSTRKVSEIGLSWGGRAQPRVTGYIHLGISQEGAKKRIQQFIFSILIFTTMIIVLGIISTVIITRRIIAPINELRQATREIAEGKLNRQINIETNDEVSDLARAFNDMLVRLQSSHAKVEHHTAEMSVALDRMRKEIAERVRTEKALKDSEKKYRMIFEESKDVIFLCSPDGKFVDINQAGVELFGYVSEEALKAADPPRDLFNDPEEYSILQKILERQGFVKDHEINMKRIDGEKLIVLMTASPIRNENGSVLAYRGVFHDVTDKRRLEIQLIQAQKIEAIGQLAGGIAHDFNNILTAIMGYGNLLLLDMPEDSPLKDSAERILSSAERAANLTRSLLAFSRKQVISPKPVNLNGIINDTRELLVRLIGEDVELKTTHESQDIMILADSGQIEQVLINLCTNARDAMPRGGQLTISISTTIVREGPADAGIVDKPGAYARITVADTGTGIDERIRGKIFEPFFTTKETGKGTGLGLSIVYGIVKQHNGYISMSSGVQTGTVFDIYLPLIDASEAALEKGPLVRPKGGTETILVAEDDSEVRKLIRLVLGGNGYRVLEAADGQDALSVFNRGEHPIDLLLLDVIMPKKNGKEVYDSIKSIDPQVRAVFMSGYTADIINKKGILEENLLFISKPIMPYELLTVIRKVLDETCPGRSSSPATNS